MKKYRKLLLLAVLFCVFLSLFVLWMCSGEKQITYDIIIEGKVFTLPVRDKWELTAKDIGPILKPYWDKLSVGHSPEIMFKRVSPFGLELDKSSIQKLKIKNMKLTSTATSSESVWFYLDKDGERGVDNGNKQKLASGVNMSWKDVNNYLAKEIIYHLHKRHSIMCNVGKN